MSGSRNSHRSPRRKAGRAVARKAKRKLSFSLVVEAQEMLVEYEPNWSDGEFPYGHFEFRSLHNPPRRIPVSETGYLSHFAPMHEVASFANPNEYASAFVRTVLDSARTRKATSTEPGQLSLF